MNRTTFGRANYLIVFSLFLFLRVVYAQAGLEAYDRGDWEAVRAYLAGNSSDPAEAQFLRAALTADGDSALEAYRQVVLKYPESPVSPRALDRIRQYYLARGRPDKAQEFEKALAGYKPPQIRLSSPPTVSSPAPPGFASDSTAQARATPPLRSPAIITGYALQVGAFSGAGNALKLKRRIQQDGYRVDVLDASASPNRLHTVRVLGFKSQAEAEKAAAALKQKYELHPIILPLSSQE